MGVKTPPFPEHPDWTEARFWAFIRSQLRRGWSKWGPKYKALELVKRKKPANKSGRHKWEYRCAHCDKWYQAKEVSVDHIIPAGTLRTYDDLPEFVRKLFVGVDKLQVLCDPCHLIKTNEERKK